MVESGGTYGIWFEWGRAHSKSKEEVEPNLKLLAYQKECERIFSGLWKMNYALGDKVGIRVNTPSLGDGLILRDTFQERDLTVRDKFVRKAFLVTENAVFKVGPLTPKALEKAEKAEVNWRLMRLALVSDEIEFQDIFLGNKAWDAEGLDKAIRWSVKAAVANSNSNDYYAKLVVLN